VAFLADPARLRPGIAETRTRINNFLRRAVQTVRRHFGGRVSYAAILPLEGVDWTPFDIIATDAAYRTAATAQRYRESIRAFVAQGCDSNKPVAVTEVGCATFRGAAAVGGTADAMIELDEHGHAARLNAECPRDENEQATYLREVLDVLVSERVDAAFVYTFARYDLPHRSDPRLDLDRASAGIVKVLDALSDAEHPRYPGMPWERKAAFTALADLYQMCARSSGMR